MSEKPMPQNQEAERALLGCLVLDNRQIDVVLDIIPGAALAQARPTRKGERKRVETVETLFFNPAHQAIFESILALHDGGGGVDLTTLANHLQGLGKLEIVGGAAYLASLEDDIFAFGQVPEYARIVSEHWRRRMVIAMARHMADGAMDTGIGIADTLGAVESEMMALASRGGKGFRSLGEVVTGQVDEIERRRQGEYGGVRTGFVGLDQVLGFLRPAQLIILGARPGQGKTALAWQICEHVARHEGRAVGVFSQEMAAGELAERAIAQGSRVGAGKIKLGNLHPGEMELIRDTASELSRIGIYIDDTSSLKASDLVRRARRLAARHPDLALVMVDYVQLMAGEAREQNRHNELSRISKALKGMAKELSIPVLVLSQLSRDNEKRKGKDDQGPVLSDLRDSGALEEDADVVIFLSRNPKDPAQAKAKVAKQRNGVLGTVELSFDGDRVAFRDRY